MFFFFSSRRRHTRWPRDWSSDVCSSDLTWLEEVDQQLGLGLEVVRARAEELHGRCSFDVVTARAVAALDKLARWTLPLVADGGELLAMKGSSADRKSGVEGRSGRQRKG